MRFESANSDVVVAILTYSARECLGGKGQVSLKKKKVALLLILGGQISLARFLRVWCVE